MSGLWKALVAFVITYSRSAGAGVVWELRSAQAPFCAGVGDVESFALGITLRIAARLRDHHGQIASVAKSVRHARFEQRGLQPAPPHLRDRGGAAEQCDAIIEAQHASRAGGSITFGKKAQTLLTGGDDGAEIEKEIAQFGMLVRPATGADLAPQLRFFGSNEAHLNRTRWVLSGRLDRPAKDVAEFDRAVAAGAEHVECGDARERAHLVEHRRAALAEEGFDDVERGRTEFLKQTEAEGLGEGRADAVEDGKGAGTLHPFRTAVGK